MLNKKKSDSPLPYYGEGWRTLATLSNSEFRKAEKRIREELLPQMPLQSYWLAMKDLVSIRPSAFITGLIVLAHHTSSAGFTLLTDEAEQFATTLAELRPDMLTKAVNIALPHLTTEQQIADLFTLFRIDDLRQRVVCLARVDTPLAYYMLFQTLKMMPEADNLVRQCCVHIMKRGGDHATNMATLMRAYFGIADLPISFAHVIQPHQLSYIDRNYDTFLRVYNGL